MVQVPDWRLKSSSEIWLRTLQIKNNEGLIDNSQQENKIGEWTKNHGPESA